VVPPPHDWDRGTLDRQDGLRSRRQGGAIYALQIDEAYGGEGRIALLAIAWWCARSRECQRLTTVGLTVSLQADLVLPYLLDLPKAEQKPALVPGLDSGELIGALRR